MESLLRIITTVITNFTQTGQQALFLKGQDPWHLGSPPKASLLPVFSPSARNLETIHNGNNLPTWTKPWEHLDPSLVNRHNYIPREYKRTKGNL